mgnify:CR=1 FL=1
MEKGSKNKKSVRVEQSIMFAGLLVAAYCVLNKIIPGICVGAVLVLFAVTLAARRTKKIRTKTNSQK